MSLHEYKKCDYCEKIETLQPVHDGQLINWIEIKQPNWKNVTDPYWRPKHFCSEKCLSDKIFETDRGGESW
jgi:hypothetical protein